MTRTFVIAFFWLSACVCIAQDQDHTKEPRRRDFAPGVSIDWKNLAVEVDAKVVLRGGPLELFACSPQTKEHESVVAVVARPLHIFQAMGLVGLRHGSPPRYDEKLDRWHTAHGEALDVRIRWKAEDGERIVLAAQWMIEKATGKPPQKLGWIFAGSKTRDQGGFAADAEGTIVCVVDFDSALIALDSRHSADDAELWLEANGKEVPPVGTRCTLIIRSAHHPKLDIEIDAQGQMRSGDTSLKMEDIAAKLAESGDRPPMVTVRTSTSDQATAQKTINQLKELMVKSRIDPAISLIVIPHGTKPPGKPDPDDKRN